MNKDWISIYDRLPEDGIGDKVKQIKVLTALKSRNGYTVRSQMRMKQFSYGQSEVYRWVWKYSGGEVTHWMPLPEAPNLNE